MSRVVLSRDSGVESDRMVRILVADRSRMASHLLVDLLGRKPNFNVVAAMVPAELPATVAKIRPQIVVLSADLDDGPTQGIEIAGRLKACAPEVRTIILANSFDQELVVAAFRAGAAGIFCRAESLDNFHKCIERVHEGQIWADTRQVRFLVEALIATAPYRVVDVRGNELLSERELEVVQLAVKGYTNREIADRMKLSEHTVKNYMFRAFDKLGVSSRVEMLFYVLNQSGKGQTLATPLGAGAIRSPLGDLQQAAEAGSISAQLALGTKYRYGTGVEKNKTDAYFWLRLAQERAKDIGEESTAALQRLASRIAPAEIELLEQRVLDWLDAHRKKTVSRMDAPKKRLA
jgi:two-component system nitrate/nitrite response regulator NarL